MSNASITNRFFSSFVGNFFRSLISFSTGILLARWLGPFDYGRMVFLFASFTAVRGLLDFGVSSAFFTLLSQKSRGKLFFLIFFSWVLIQIFIGIIFLLYLLPVDFLSEIYFEKSRLLLCIAFLATIMQGTVWNCVAQMIENIRQTSKLQKLNNLVVVFHLFAMCALWIYGGLSLPLIFLGTIFEWVLASYVAIRFYLKSGAVAAEDREPFKKIFLEFYRYCSPLIPYSIVSFFYVFADRWMLQYWGGADEQGYYGVAQQISAVALLATTAILRIFWKEVAEAHHLGDREKVSQIYTRTSRFLFFVSAFIIGAVLPWGRELLDISVGAAYGASLSTVTIMLFYPLHQSIGQISGVMLYATGYVKLNTLIGMLSMLASLPLTYLFMASTEADIPGLNLGSVGLACKMVLLQFITVNFTTLFISRIFKCKFDWKYQIICLGACCGLGMAGFEISQFSFHDSTEFVLPKMIVGMLLYGILVAISIYKMPFIVGLTKRELRYFSRKFSSYLTV